MSDATNAFGTVIRHLWIRLEAIGDTHPELYDSDVREALDDAVWRGFIKTTSDYLLPHHFAMHTDEGNARVREALSWFLSASHQAALQTGLETFRARLHGFQDSSVRTSRQNDYNDFFGWSNPEAFDDSGNVIR